MRVKSKRIIKYDDPIPVYDFEVAVTHNFKLGAGVFVHNCGGKDISDAVAGSVMSASMNREVRTETDVVDQSGNSLRDPRRRMKERRRARRR